MLQKWIDTNYAKKFQFLNGAIKIFSATIFKESLAYFNSLMVRLKFWAGNLLLGTMLISIP